jgi:cell division septation protein DedD
MASRPYIFSFNFFELSTLLVVVLASSFFVFLCGLYVGKRVQERGSTQEGRAVRLPVIVIPEAEESKQEEPDLSLLTELPALEAKPGEASQRGTARSVRRSGGSAVDEDREQSLPSKQQQLSEASQRGTARPVRRSGGTAVSGREGAELAESKQPPVPGQSKMVQSVPAGGLWGVQVEATRDEAAASAVVRQLRAKGYEAYIVRVRKQGETWYRVRVGRFASVTEASSMAARLRREGKITQAFVVSE